jgi:hypothetical protein
MCWYSMSFWAIWSYHSIANVLAIQVVDFSISSHRCFSPNPWLVATSSNLYLFLSLNFLCHSFCEAFLWASISFCEVILWAFACNCSWVLCLSCQAFHWPSRNISNHSTNVSRETYNVKNLTIKETLTYIPHRSHGDGRKGGWWWWPSKLP